MDALSGFFENQAKWLAKNKNPRRKRRRIKPKEIN